MRALIRVHVFRLATDIFLKKTLDKCLECGNFPLLVCQCEPEPPIVIVPPVFPHAIPCSLAARFVLYLVSDMLCKMFSIKGTKFVIWLGNIFG